MNEEDAYNIGVEAAKLKKKYALEDVVVVGNIFWKEHANNRFFEGWNSVFPDGDKSHWRTELPLISGVYRVDDRTILNDIAPRWARYDLQMGWSKSTKIRPDLDRPTLPFVTDCWPWRVE